jgi:hypothetical protein
VAVATKLADHAAVVTALVVGAEAKADVVHPAADQLVVAEDEVAMKVVVISLQEDAQLAIPRQQTVERKQRVPINGRRAAIVHVAMKIARQVLSQDKVNKMVDVPKVDAAVSHVMRVRPERKPINRAAHNQIAVVMAMDQLAMVNIATPIVRKKVATVIRQVKATKRRHHRLRSGKRSVVSSNAFSAVDR